MKGRENYLCRLRYKAFARQPTFSVPGEAELFQGLTDWAETTKTGDRAELTDFPEQFMTWADLSAAADRCLGGKCPEFQNCFLQMARRAAARADLVVVNHHLFMADLAVRGQGPGEVIPEYEAAIFDEAHQVEDVATQHFGLEVSTWRLVRLRHDAERILARGGRLDPDLARALAGLGHQADTMARDVLPRTDETELWRDDRPDMDALRTLGGRVMTLMDDIAGRAERLAKGDEEVEAVAERARRITGDLGFILEGTDHTFVYWAERRGRGLFLRASPIDVASCLRDNLFAQGLPLVFTSATLTAQGSFDYLKQRLGVLDEVEGVLAPSPFDFEHQTLLYVPRSMPAPNHPDYLPSLAREIELLLKLSRGRAFVLFTSYRNLNYVAGEIEDRAPWPLLVQGRAPRTVLLDRFREETESVLLATQSFWQGVDVPGESLSAVIIDKLPFPRPDRPLVRARSDRLKEEGLDPFFHYSVPEAIITLKQGLGRLIRTGGDRGVLAVLDVRLIHKGYGKRFLESLHRSPLTHDPEHIRDFFAIQVD